MRLDKYLSNAGIGSRKDVKKMIKDERVLVNNHLVKSEKFNVDENKDIVLLDNQKIDYLISGQIGFGHSVAEHKLNRKTEKRPDKRNAYTIENRTQKYRAVFKNKLVCGKCNAARNYRIAVLQ